MSTPEDTVLDFEEQLLRMSQMDADIAQKMQSIKIAKWQVILNAIGTFTALGTAIIAAISFFKAH